MMSELVRALHERGFRQLLLEWPHMADWVLTDFVQDTQLEPNWQPPGWFYSALIAAVRDFNRTLPQAERVAVRGIDMNLQEYAGAQEFKGSLRGLSHHLTDPGPVAPFLQGDYSTSEAQVEQLETLRTALETGRSSLIGSWGQYWYETVIEMVEVNDLEVSAKIANSDESSFNGASAYLFDVGSAQYQVTLRTLLPVIPSNEKSREARFVFTDKKAIPGSTGRLRWQSEMSYLPAHLLLKRDGKRGYFIVEQLGDKNSAKFIAVSSAEEGRPLAFNMTPNTRIITEGRHGLNHGDEIEVTKQSKMSHGDKS